MVFREDVFPLKGITYEGTTIFYVPHSVNDHHHPDPSPIPMPASYAPVYNNPASFSGVPEVANNTQHSTVEADEVSPVEHSFPPVPHPADLRRTTRSANLPIWLKDYVTTKSGGKSGGVTLYSISDVLSYDNVSPAYQAYLQAFLAQIEPQNLKEAAKNEHWIKAM